MTAPWTPEHAVTPARAADLIAAQFPELGPASIVPYGAGWDNTAFLVNDALVFRFPRRALGAMTLEAEVAVLPHLAGRLRVATPVPRWIGAPAGDFPWLFSGYARLPGRTACALRLDDADRIALGAPIGDALRALHAVEDAEAASWGAPRDVIGRMDLERRVPQAHERLTELEQRGIVADTAPLRAIVDAAVARAEDAPRVLVHGDLYARHLLIDGGRLSGIIDWGDVHRGDPAIDLALACGFLPPAARPAFLRAYGPVDDATWARARFRAVAHTASVMLYAHDVDDADLAFECRCALAHVGREV